MIVRPEYIHLMLGISPDQITEELIELVEFKVASLLGCLYQDTLTDRFYLLDSSSIFTLREVPVEVQSVKYRLSAGSDMIELTPEEYRVVGKQIIVDSPIPQGSDVEITYEVGWTSENLPELVKLLILYVFLDTYESLHPGSITLSQIESIKIGDYSVKYGLSDSQKNELSLKSRIDQLVTLIKQGSLEPGASL